MLVAYGRELEAQGAAQVGGSFSGMSAADELLERDANAFLIGVLFTQGIPAERAWQAPYLLRERLGTLDPGYLSEHPDEVRAAVQRPPMLHRFKETLPRWIVSAAARLEADYGGDAAAIWAPGAHVLDGSRATGRVRRHRAQEGRHGGRDSSLGTSGSRLRAGRPDRSRSTSMCAVSSCAAGWSKKTRAKLSRRAAARWAPDAPGLLDLPAWLIGREACRPRAPHCDECRLGRGLPSPCVDQAAGCRRTAERSAG